MRQCKHESRGSWRSGSGWIKSVTTVLIVLWMILLFRWSQTSYSETAIMRWLRSTNLFEVVVLTLVAVGIVVIIKNQEKLMSTGVTSAQALADLQAALADIQTRLQTIAQNQANLDVAIAQLEAEVQSGQGVNVDAIENVVAQLKTVSSNLGDLNTDITNQTTGIGAAENPAPTPTPEPGT